MRTAGACGSRQGGSARRPRHGKQAQPCWKARTKGRSPIRLLPSGKHPVPARPSRAPHPGTRLSTCATATQMRALLAASSLLLTLTIAISVPSCAVPQNVAVAISPPRRRLDACDGGSTPGAGRRRGRAGRQPMPAHRQLAGAVHRGGAVRTGRPPWSHRHRPGRQCRLHGPVCGASGGLLPDLAARHPARQR